MIIAGESAEASIAVGFPRLALLGNAGAEASLSLPFFIDEFATVSDSDCAEDLEKYSVKLANSAAVYEKFMNYKTA